jgi:hypothetical protein
MLTAARRGDPALLPIAGFDTFWYTWSGVNRDTRLLDR